MGAGVQLHHCAPQSSCGCVFSYHTMEKKSQALAAAMRLLNKRKRDGKDVAAKSKRSSASASSLTAKKAETESNNNNNNTSWQQKFYELVLFQSRHEGSSILPYYDPEYQALSKWVRNERTLYKKHRKGEVDLDQEQLDHLEALKQIGFVFEARIEKPFSDAINEKWQGKFNELVEYKDNNGHCNPPTKSKVGQWVNTQRMAYKEYQSFLAYHSKKYPNHRPLLPEEMPRRNRSTHPKEDGICNPITQERINKLNSLDGFLWDVSPRWTSFEQRVEEYKQFQKEEGHGFIPQHYSDNPSLGKWVSKTRYEYTLFNRGDKSQLTVEKTRVLESIGFEFFSASKTQSNTEQSTM